MKVFWMIILAGIGSTLFVIALFGRFSDPGWIHVALYVWSVILGLVAFGLLMVILDDRRLEIEEQVARIEVLKDKELKRLDLYTRIPLPGWPYMMGERGLVVDARGSNPVTKVRLMFGEVPQNFIKGFILGARDPNFVRAVRSYDEHETWEEDGGNCREYATICIRHILEKQYAGGLPNTPKRWTTNGRTQFQYEAGLGIKEIK